MSFLIDLQLRGKRLQPSSFPMNFAKCLRTPFLQNTFGRLLLSIAMYMPRAFKTKCEKNESNNILITYLYILMVSTFMWMNIHQFIKKISACKNKVKPYKFISNHNWRSYLSLLFDHEELQKTAYYKTRNTGTRNYGTRNTGGTPEHWWNTGTLAEHRSTGGTTEHWRNNRNTTKWWNMRRAAE